MPVCIHGINGEHGLLSCIKSIGMKKISALVFTFLYFTILPAQDPCASLNYHAFKAESVSGTYTDLDNLGREIDVSNLDDGISEPQEIGFDFEFHCQHFTQFIFNTNGFIKLGTETTPKTNLFFQMPSQRLKVFSTMRIRIM